MFYVLAHLAALGALAAAFGLAGFALERSWLRHDDAGGLRALSRAVLGVVAWMLALFALACVGRLDAISMAIVALLCAIAATLAWRRFGRGAAESAAGLFVGVAFVVTAPLLLLSLSQEVSWDASAYHLTLAKRWLAAGGFEPVAMNVYSNWPLATELLFAGAMAFSDHGLAKALHAGFGLATLWAAMLGARAFHRDASGWLAAPLLLATPVVLFEWSIAYVELAYAFFFLAGLLFVTRWRSRGGEAREALWLAGVCGGALAGLKVNGLFGAAAIGAGVAAPLVARLFRGEVRSACADALRFGVPVLLLWLPWLAKSALYTGNPVYPLLYDVFGGPDWSPQLAQQFADWQRSIGMGRSLVDYALLPLRVILEGSPGFERFYGDIGRHWLVVLPLAIAGRRNPLVRSALLVSAAYFVLWALGAQQMRFLIPILPPLALAGSIGAVELVGRLADPRARRAATAGAAVAATVLALSTARGPFEQAAKLLPELAAGGDSLREAARHPVHRFVASLPQETKLLLLNTNQGFFIERDHLSDSFFEASQIADWLRDSATPHSVIARLRERGITHVLLENRSWDIAWPPALLALLADRELAAPRYHSSDGRFDVFELR